MTLLKKSKIPKLIPELDMTLLNISKNPITVKVPNRIIFQLQLGITNKKSKKGSHRLPYNKVTHNLAEVPKPGSCRDTELVQFIVLFSLAATAAFKWLEYNRYGRALALKQKRRRHGGG